MNTKDFVKFKNRELKANLLLAFICYASVFISKVYNLGHLLHSLLSNTFMIGSVTYYIFTIIFLHRYKSNYAVLGFNNFRKYYLKFLYFALLPLLFLLTDGHLFGLGENILGYILAVLGYLLFFILIFLPVVNIIVFSVEYMEFEQDWKR